MRHHVRIVAALPLLVFPMLTTLGCAREGDPSPLALAEVQEKEPLAAAPDNSVACAGNSGVPLTTYHGVPFYSNGACTGTWDGPYQCPEVVKRYSQHMDWHGHARTYCDPDTLRERNLLFLPNERDSLGLNGDIVAFDGPSCGKGVGHVGLRCGTPDAGHWQLCDQNRTQRAFDDPLRLPRVGGALATFEPSCLVCGSSRPGWDFSEVHGLGKGSFGWTLEDMTLVSTDAAAIRLSPGVSDPQLLSPSALRINPNPAAGGYGQLHLFLRSRGVSRSLRVHFTTASDRGWDEEKAVEAPIPATPGWHDVVVHLAQNPRWVSGGRIDQIRIDPGRGRSVSSSGEIIDIDWIRFDR
jgi:hypothetical protein